MNTRGIFSAMLGAVMMLGASPGMAVDPTFQIAANSIQRVPTSFKFQAAISQAKMPVGEAVFQTLIVNLKKGDEVMCSETFNDVKVRDSVLNLDIGNQMSCDMDAVMAEHSGLTFQVCIGGAENCLKPVELGTVPYAVKSNFAVQAQEAHTSDISVQSHYSHRVTADRDLFESQAIGAGYFDFYTEDTGTLASTLQMLDAVTLVDDQRDTDVSVVGYTPAGTDGYVQWVPTQGTLKTLNVCARDLDTDLPAMLDRLVFHSNAVTLRGDQEVFGSSVTTGDVDIGGGLEVFSNADFYDNVNVEENLHVKMESDLDLAVRANSTLTVADHTQLNATLTVADLQASTLGGTLLVKEDSTLEGDVNALQSLNVSGVSTLTDNVFAQNNLDVTGNATVQADANVNGVATFAGDVYAQSDLDVTGNATVQADATINGVSTFAGDAYAQSNFDVAGDASFQNDVSVTGQITIGQNGQSATTMSIYHNVSFLGDVTIPSDSISYNFGNQEIVYSQNILDGEIATVDLANDAVTTAKIANDAVTTAKIADDAVTNDKIFTLDASKLTGTINNGRIGGLTNLDIAGNAAIAGTKIDTLPASKLTGTINNDRISGLTTDDLAPEAEISSDQILELDADKLTGTISNLRISGLTNNDLSTAAGITHEKISSINASRLTTGTVPTARLPEIELSCNTVYQRTEDPDNSGDVGLDAGEFDEVTKSCDAGQVAVDGWVEWGATSVNNQAICYGSSLSVRKGMTDGYLTNYIMAYNYTTYRAGFKNGYGGSTERCGTLYVRCCNIQVGSSSGGPAEGL